MTHPVSIRFKSKAAPSRLRTEASVRGLSISALAEELIEEGLRMRAHPLIQFRPGPSGRRAALLRGPDVWEVVGGVVGGDVPPPERMDRTVAVFGLLPAQVEAALDYYAAFRDEIDREISQNLRETEEAEKTWRTRQSLLGE